MQVSAMIERLPEWAGTVPQWFLFASVLITFIKLYPVMKKQHTDAASRQVEQYETTCARLRADVSELIDRVTECEESCRNDKNALEEKILGLRRQQIADQIALVNTIIHNVDAPELKTLLSAMEKVQLGLRHVQIIQDSMIGAEDGAQGA